MFMPPLPGNLSEQEGIITDVVAVSYQGLLAKIQEEMQYLFDVNRSTLGVQVGYIYDLGHAVAQLVDTLHYKPEGRGFDSRRCH